MNAIDRVAALEAELAKVRAEARKEIEAQKDKDLAELCKILTGIPSLLAYPEETCARLESALSFRFAVPESPRSTSTGHARIPLPEAGVRMVYRTRMGVWTGATIGGRFKVEGIEGTFDSLTAAATAVNRAENPGTQTRTSGQVWRKAE